jgi:hypothetical protein
MRKILAQAIRVTRILLAGFSTARFALKFKGRATQQPSYRV